MSKSQLIDEALAGEKLPAEFARASDHPCEGSRFHSPTPLVTSEVGLEGARTVWLCGTCENNLGVFVLLAESAKAPLPWPLLRGFGNQIRILGRALSKQPGAAVDG